MQPNIRIYWVNLSKRGGNDGAFQPDENPVLQDSFTQIYILFLKYFHVGPPKMYRRFRIGLPKIHRRFRTGPPQVYLSLLPPEFHERGILLTIAI